MFSIDRVLSLEPVTQSYHYRKYTMEWIKIASLLTIIACIYIT